MLFDPSHTLALHIDLRLECHLLLLSEQGFRRVTFVGKRL